jgi:hypothetical protein
VGGIGLHKLESITKGIPFSHNGVYTYRTQRQLEIQFHNFAHRHFNGSIADMPDSLISST